MPNSVLENVFMAAAMDDDMGNNHAGRWEICTFVGYIHMFR